MKIIRNKELVIAFISALFATLVNASAATELISASKANEQVILK
jgi:hypothetical protein